MNSKLIKSFLSLTIALVICFCTAFPVSSMAEPVKDGERSAFEISPEGTLSVKAGTEFFGRLEVPAKLNGIAVKAIGEYAFFGHEAITELILPDGVEYIGAYAFALCTGLEEVYISDSVRFIGDSAFEACVSLKELVVPDSVLRIGMDVISGCSSLKSIEMPYVNFETEKNPYLALGSCSSLKDVYISLVGPELYSEAVFGYEAYNPFTVHMGESPSGRSKAETKDEYYYISSHGVLYAKYKPDDMLSGRISIPKSLDGIAVTAIGPNAFAFQDEIESIELPEGITRIEDMAFCTCSTKRFELPDSLRYVGTQAFTAAQLDGVTLPAGLEALGPLAAFIIDEQPMELSYLGTKATWSSLDTELPEGSIVHARDGDVKHIFEGDFFISSNGTLSVCKSSRQSISGDIAIPESVGGVAVKSIGYLSFYNTQIESVAIPDGVEKINDVAFMGSTLRSVKLPAALRYIGSSAFARCRSLSSVSSFPDGLEHLGQASFQGCSSLNNIDFLEDFPYISHSCFADCALGNLELPSGVIHIGREAFSDCLMSSLKLSEGVRSIAPYAFSLFHVDNELHTLYLPRSLEYIHKAFCYNSAVEDIFFAGSREQWKIISENDFYDPNNDYFYPKDYGLHFAS